MKHFTINIVLLFGLAIASEHQQDLGSIENDKAKLLLNVHPVDDQNLLSLETPSSSFVHPVRVSLRGQESLMRREQKGSETKPKTHHLRLDKLTKGQNPSGGYSNPAPYVLGQRRQLKIYRRIGRDRARRGPPRHNRRTPIGRQRPLRRGYSHTRRGTPKGPGDRIISGTHPQRVRPPRPPADRVISQGRQDYNRYGGRHYHRPGDWTIAQRQPSQAGFAQGRSPYTPGYRRPPAQGSYYRPPTRGPSTYMQPAYRPPTRQPYSWPQMRGPSAYQYPPKDTERTPGGFWGSWGQRDGGPVIIGSPADYRTPGPYDERDPNSDCKQRFPTTTEEPNCGDVSVLLEGLNGDTRDCLDTLNRDIKAEFNVGVKHEKDCDDNENTVLCIEVAADVYEDECADFADDAKDYLGEDLPESCKVERRFKTIRRRHSGEP